MTRGLNAFWQFVVIGAAIFIVVGYILIVGLADKEIAASQVAFPLALMFLTLSFVVWRISHAAERKQKKLWGYKQELEKEVRERTLDVQEVKIDIEKERARLTASINSLSLGFAILDWNNKVVYSNQTLQNILELKNGISDFENAAKQLGGKTFDLLKQCQECISEKKTFEIKEVSFGQRYLRILLSPILVGQSNQKETIGVTLLLEDITTAKLLERGREEFFALASHELRTPLTVIRGNTSLLQTFFAEEIKKPVVQEIVSDVHEATIRLIKIVNDFLDASRLEQGSVVFKKEKVNLVPLIESVVKTMMPEALEKKLYLKIEKPGEGDYCAVADEEKVRQIIANLIDNAIKFTQTGGVLVRLDGNDFLKVYVQDTGGGISPINQKLLFKKFQQAGENILTRDVSHGTGLGLYISKLLALNMEGDLDLVESDLDKGSIFRLRLPIFKKRPI